MRSASKTLVTMILCAAFAISTVAASAATLNGSGASFPFPYYTKTFAEFKDRTGIQVNYQATGSGAGIDAITKKTVDFAGSDAALSDAKLKDLPGKLFQIPTCGGAVAVVYNVPGASRDLKLSASSVAGIFLGQIKRWNDPKLVAENAELRSKNLPITVCHRSDGSGTTDIFTTYLSAVSPTWKSKVGKGTAVKWPTGKGGAKNAGVAALVKQIPGAIGYVELAYAKQNGIATARIKNRSGYYIKPSLPSTSACIEGALSALKNDLRADIVNSSGRDAYPIVGLTFIFVYENSVQPAELKRLLSWLMSDESMAIAKGLEYAPLPNSVRAICKDMIAKLK